MEGSPRSPVARCQHCDERFADTVRPTLEAQSGVACLLRAASFVRGRYTNTKREVLFHTVSHRRQGCGAEALDGSVGIGFAYLRHANIGADHFKFADVCPGQTRLRPPLDRRTCRERN
ncbi:hypothetical protein EVAR_50763_1 [Eumeta japonica]|uniref:Uncharacterized protein n=1 Tax=Eumeta variegata TaxID=151549 RepID=A0A4C1Y4S9_EUMVA|nr:hypothetical protein EVAR_50763_1 [Eumeta japonica]